MRGSIEGGLWALGIGVFGLGFASLASEQPVPLQSPRAPQVAMPQLPPSSVIEDGVAALGGETAITPTQPVQAPVQSAEPDAPLTTDLTPAAPVLLTDLPVAAVAPVANAVPTRPAVNQAPAVAATRVSPPQAAPMPQAPVLNTQPAVPPIAVAEAVVAAPEPVTVVDAEVAPEPTTDPVVAETATTAPAVPTPEPAPVVEPAPAPVVVAQAPVAPVEVTPEAEDVVVAQQQSQAPQVRINRLTQEPEEPVVEIPVVEETDPDAPALARYAATFENPQNLPMIGVILIDVGQMPDASSALAGLGFAPTVAIDILSPDAVGRVANLRGAGAEVAMQMSLPDGARPTDVEVTFEVASAAMAEVGIMFSDGTGTLQRDRSVTAQVMNILDANGQGFVTVQRGLGNAARAADQADVPNATILRDLDGNGESAAAIGRALDQAAFRARQSGGAVLMGRMSETTLAALRDWAAEAESNGIAIAPVSAILLDQAG